jgi:hypothetical protein
MAAAFDNPGVQSIIPGYVLKLESVRVESTQNNRPLRFVRASCLFHKSPPYLASVVPAIVEFHQPWSFYYTANPGCLNGGDRW